MENIISHKDKIEEYLNLQSKYIAKQKELYKLKARLKSLKLKIKYNFTCPSCQRQEPEIKLERDHVIAKSNGGNNAIANMQLLCKSCNMKKFTRTIDFRNKHRKPNISINRHPYNHGVKPKFTL